eukprot:TRINITY_DN18478_c0_g1_i1.p1 TRINITY_DN18478_c0_g1~~TRINITY_DN18478_c0_g1_i1.p1  ORF type:complete len:661 (+),score=170.21 TRINITY_DN18478_c0_g1_i1:166-2148(+)
MTSLKDFGYEDIKVIGRGQYGKAHLVTSAKDNSTAIAKTIDLTCLSNKERETSLQEVELLRRLDHPNIVEYRDNFFMGDTLVIVMQYCEGGDLATYIKDNARKKMRIHEVQIMNYFVQVLQALQYIHHERILHRDLKTSNLFLMMSKSVVKLGDFGISRVLEGSTLAAITVVGTPYYMSPEVCENRPYTFKSDVWALGCVLYELCMLKHAFSADNLLGLVYKIVSDKYEPIPSIYSQSLNALIQRMLEKSADKRPSVRELLADSYVQSFMNEYVRTRGQCATAAASQQRRTGGGGGHRSGGASRARSGQDAGGAGGGGGSGAPGGGGGSRGSDAGGSLASTAAPSASVARSARPARTRAAPGQPASGGGQRNETPKEAAARRKREAADREVEKLKAAAKQSAANKTVARRMKEAEFGTTRFGIQRGLASPASSTLTEDGATRMNEDASTAADDHASWGSGTPEEYLDEPLEEISEGSSCEEEYEDDFEDDFCSEDEDYTDMDDPAHAVVGAHLSTVREEQDWTRVMSNYVQDLARTSESPQPRRSGSSASQAPSAPAAAAAPQAASPAGACGAGPPGGGAQIMDIHARARRVREDLVQKMGAETFKVAFDYLFQARSVNTDERTVRRDLEALLGHLGRDTYKQYCFEVDQLVFQQMLYSS